MSAFAWIPDFFLAISQTKVKDSVMWHNFSILLSQALEFVRINSIFDKLELASNDLRAESLNVFEPKLMVINITHILYSSTVDSTHNAQCTGFCVSHELRWICESRECSGSSFHFYRIDAMRHLTGFHLGFIARAINLLHCIESMHNNK